jgi:predicted PurR-regulated permease PerM
MLAAIWILTLLGLAVWSLLAWGLHTLLTIDPRWIDDVQALIERVPYADVIDRWLPGWRELLDLAMDLTQTVLGWVGSNAPLVAWIVWGIGTLALLAMAGVLSLVVSLLRDKRPAPPTGPRVSA